MDPIVELQQSWRKGFAGQRLTQHLREWGEREPALAHFQGEAPRLFRFFRTPPSPERDAVFCALLREAKRDQLAGLVVLEALTPGLKALYGAILFDASESEELWALLLANAWQRIVGYPVERRPGRVAANLLLDTRKATLRELIRQRPDPAMQLSGREPAPEQRPDAELPLLRALASGVLSRSEAELILETRFGDRSLAAVADELGVPYITVYQRRARAERRLLLSLAERPVKNRPSDRHMSTARSAAFELADSASGGAGT